MLYSHDGGRTWSRRHLLQGLHGTILHQDLDLYSVQFAPDGRNGWLVGEKGLIMHTSDGGKNWQVQHSQATTRLLAVAAVGDQDVAIVGDHGTLLWSGDGGVTWTFKQLNNLTFYGVAFADDHNGWVVGEFETILHSEDGGKSWQVQRGGEVADFTVPPYFTVIPEDGQNITAAGQSGVYASSKDGGKSWQDGKLPSERSIYGGAVGRAAATPGIIWLAGAEGTIFEGTPGGEWKLKNPIFQDLTSVASSKEFGLAVGLGGTVLRTSNGDNWELITERK